MKKLAKPERKKLAAIYRKAATLVQRGKEYRGCCSALCLALRACREKQFSSFSYTAFDLFREMFKPIRSEGGVWWWVFDETQVEPRRFALLIAAEEAERGTITDYAQD